MKLTGIRQKVFLDRYALKDKQGKPIEKQPEQMWRRVARGVAVVEKKGKRRQWEKKFYQAMKDFKYIPGGRILSGAGTGYKVTFYNCFVLPSPHDSRDGILDNLKEMVEIMARGGGVGINLSSLRPRGARVKKVNGFSSGPMNWAELYSVATHDIIQQGGSRRGALMLMLWDWHPDVEEFIIVKRDLSRITGANLSVCVSDKFMQAVKKNKDWELVFPNLNDPEYDEKWRGYLDDWLAMGKKIKVYKKVKARKLWDLICEAAWTSAEPGVVFMERYNKWYNNWYFNKVNCVNPCVTGDTLVATEVGWLPARDLKPGLRIATADGLKPIERFYNNGKKRIFKVKFSDGGELKATADHKLKVVREKKYKWVRISKLSVGDKVVVIDKTYFRGDNLNVSNEARQYADKNDIQLQKAGDRELGFIIGVTIGDGYFGQIGKKLGYRMKLSVGRKEREWKKILEKKLLQFGVKPKFKRYETQVLHADGTVATHGCDQLVLYKFANMLGLLGLKPKTGENKTIPTGFLNLSSEFQRGLLDGLFSTDGSVSLKSYDPLLRLTSVSLRLLRQVRLLLLNFGIHSRIYEHKRKKTVYDGRDITGTGRKYELLIMNEGIIKFWQEIGLTHPDKKKKLKKIVDEYYFMSGTNLAAVKEIKDTGLEEAVFDIYEPETLTWVTNGYVSLDCGEEGLPEYGVCNLGSINLAAHVNDDGKMEYKKLKESVKIAVRFQDDVIDSDIYIFPEIRETQVEGERRIGVGTMGLGDALIKMKIRYGSEKSLAVIEKIYRTIRDTAYAASVELAREKGPFPKFDAKKYLRGYFIKKLDKRLRAKIKKYGIRNSILLQQAPTGSTSLLTGVSSGIEPVYEFSFIRRDRLGEHKLYHPLYQAWRKKHPGKPVPDYFVSANDLTPEDHVRVQAVIQKHVDASISKTVNAPKTYTVEDVKKLYTLAYDLGCKGITFMREGSRPGVLEREKKTDKAEKQAAKQPAVWAKKTPRPPVVRGSTYQVHTPVGIAYVTINTIDGEPLEVFINIGKAGSDVQAMAEALGRIISLNLRMASPLSGKERIKLAFNELIGIGGSRSLGFGPNRVRSLPDAIAKAIASHFGFRVRNGNGPVFVGNGEVKETKGVASALGKLKTTVKSLVAPISAQDSLPYLETVDLCPDCGEAALAYEEGCKKCYSCGFSEC